jgi:hypothetical protein
MDSSSYIWRREAREQEKFNSAGPFRGSCGCRQAFTRTCFSSFAISPAITSRRCANASNAALPVWPAPVDISANRTKQVCCCYTCRHARGVRALQKNQSAHAPPAQATAQACPDQPDSWLHGYLLPFAANRVCSTVISSLQCLKQRLALAEGRQVASAAQPGLCCLITCGTDSWQQQHAQCGEKAVKKTQTQTCGVQM